VKVSVIVAFDSNLLIGCENKLPWHLPADLKHFKTITMGHYMIMGRKTYESIGKPLPGRTSVVITRQKDFVAEGCIIASSIQDALAKCVDQDEVFIIGGAEIFNACMPLAQKLYTTVIHHRFAGDTHFPAINDKEWNKISVIHNSADEKNPWPYSFEEYVRQL
jgi:dihydrofolate reductase